MYYVLAHSSLNEVHCGEALALCLETYPINARNADGATAMDMALIAKDFDAAKFLRKHGGTCSPLFRGYPELKLALDVLGVESEGSDDRGFPFEEMTPDQREMIVKAIKFGGLSPDREIEMGSGYRADGRLLRCSIFGLSLYHAEMKIAETCLQQGVDVNAVIKKIEYISELGGDCTDEEGTPMEIIQSRYRGASEISLPACSKGMGQRMSKLQHRWTQSKHERLGRAMTELFF